jgi:cytochrome c oxidase assembly protein subunit 15
MGNTAYLKLNWLSIFFIFMLFVIGGLVRSTGSGMGCPDWPKCFGEYVPPTSVDALPPNYEHFFKEQRVEKTERFVALLKTLGLNKKAEQIAQSKELNDVHQFNVTKAYVEYINRLWGAVTGLIVFICFLLSFKYLNLNKWVFIFTLIGFIAVFFNALLGAVVVNSNLVGGIVTAHFIAAFASICFFILARHYAEPFALLKLTAENKKLALLLLGLISLQVLLGAELRELFDSLTSLLSLKENSSALYPNFQIHAMVGVITSVVAIYQFIKLPKQASASKYAKWIMLFSVAQLLFGPIALFPQTAAISKLFHISLGAAIFVLQFYICTSLLSSSRISS